MKNTLRSTVTDLDSALATIIAAHEHSRLNRVSTFREVACRIFPAGDHPLGHRNSMRRLRRFIATDPEILDRMRRAGYSTQHSYLTARQIDILGEYV